MTRQQRLRRVVLISCHFVRNMAYYRAGWRQRLLIRTSDFWKSINGNCIDIAVLEWCKLFAEPRGLHYWETVVTDVHAFEAGLLQAVGPGWSRESFDGYARHVRIFRDKFVAHLDNELEAHVPSLDDCWKSVHFYHSYVVNEAANVSLHGLPRDLAAYYHLKLTEAATEYGAQET